MTGRIRWEDAQRLSSRPGTTFLDNLGLGVLVGALRLARERGCRFGVAASASEHVMKTFTITGLTRVFDIRSTTEAFTADEAGEDQARP